MGSILLYSAIQINLSIVSKSGEGLTAAIVTNKTSMPILEGILISAEQGLLTLATYNLEMGMKKEMYCSCEDAGDIVINARLLSDILRKLDGAQVIIEADDSLMCHIKSGEATFDIMGMAASDFPEMPSVSDGSKITVDGKIFCEILRAAVQMGLENTADVFARINLPHCRDERVHLLRMMGVIVNVNKVLSVNDVVEAALDTGEVA